MYCGKCGTEITGAGKFCPKCGAEIFAQETTAPKPETRQGTDFSRIKKDTEVQERHLEEQHIRQLSASFISQNEKFITSLGNGYIVNYLTEKSLSNGFAFITDKRVYFKGSCLSGTGKKFTKTDEERTVDIKEITGSGFTYRKKVGLLYAAIGSLIILIVALFILAVSTTSSAPAITLIEPDSSALAIIEPGSSAPAIIEPGKSSSSQKGLSESTKSILELLAACIPSIILFNSYLFSRQTLFRIEYAGGYIAFDASFYARAEIDDFQKQLRRAKDLAEESATKIAVTEPSVQPSTQNSVPDDLRKYAELLKEGLISQEEYDAMKKKILNL